MMAITKKRINETNNHQNDKQRKLYDGPLLEIERLNSLSASAGQSIHAVSLRSDGTFVEVLLPAKLSKKAKLVGSWDLIEVFLVVLEHQDDGDILFNAHILQEPFHRTKFRGDIILIRHDVEGSPVDFSITSYKKFLELESTEMSFDFYDSILSGDDNSENKMNKEDMNRVDQSASALAEQDFYKYMLGEKFQKFRADNRRDLTKEEILKLLCSCY